MGRKNGVINKPGQWEGLGASRELIARESKGARNEHRARARHFILARSMMML